MRLHYLLFAASISFAADLRVAPFQADVTPPLGTPLCFALVPPGVQVVDPLTARGVVLLGAGKPIVLTAVDWLGISNEAHDHWRAGIARAAGTSPDRVTVHVLHQHDAPGHDDTASRLTRSAGLPDAIQSDAFSAEAVKRVAAAVSEAMKKGQRVTHVGLGSGKVERVASNRRILGPDGKVKLMRLSSSRNAEAIAAPEGTIDPDLQTITFWNGERAIAAITYYATHPQSHYAKGGISWEFVGMARAAREKALGFPHIHFNGASGNVAAGKYNDGSTENRPRLAERFEAGMKASFESTIKHAVSTRDVRWDTLPVALPLRDPSEGAKLRAVVNDANAKTADRLRAARDLAFVERVEKGNKILLSRLRVGPAEVIHLPGELFIEYQIEARKIRNGKLAVAAYGDLGPGYIGTRIAYGQGGYETGIVSRTAPAVEDVLMGAIRELLAK